MGGLRQDRQADHRPEDGGVARQVRHHLHHGADRRRDGQRVQTSGLRGVVAEVSQAYTQERYRARRKGFFPADSRFPAVTASQSR